MSSNIDFDYIVSKQTLAFIENTCYEYKVRILKDFSQNIDVSFEELKTKFLDKPVKKVKYHGKPRDKIDDSKCMARVWHKTLGPVQCSRKKPKPDDCNDLSPMFCKLHQKKLNYGRIDLPFEDYNI